MRNGRLIILTLVSAVLLVVLSVGQLATAQLAPAAAPRLSAPRFDDRDAVGIPGANLAPSAESSRPVDRIDHNYAAVWQPTNPPTPGHESLSVPPGPAAHAARLSEPSPIVEPPCAASPALPVWWSSPPQSAVTAIVLIEGDEHEIAMPGPEDEVKVIVQLEDEPVWVYRARLAARRGPLTGSDRATIRAYAQEVRARQRRLVEEIQAEGIAANVRRSFDFVLNGLAVTVQSRDAQRIEALPGVASVHRDYQVQADLADSVPLIGADEVWTMTGPGGHPVTGEGIDIAILDTGVDYTHPDLGGCFGAGCKVVDGYDFVNADGDPMDDHGHGTHCAGIAAADGTVTGVAPDASIYAYKVLNQYGSGWTSDIIAAIERAVNPDGDPATDDAVDVISMSLGGRGDPDDPMALAVDAAVDQGVVVAVSAGNSGPGYQTVGSPGVARGAFTVGATDKSDTIALFSSRGPVSGFYDLVKPDIVAPGVSINAPHLGHGYVSMSGTSMSAPHVAGAAALIKQLNPTWTPQMIQANLMNTTVDLGLDIYTQGAGRVQVNDAANVQAVLTPGSLGFGAVDTGQAIWSKTEMLQLTNVGDTSRNYSLSVSGALPTGVTTTLSHQDVTVAAGDTITFTLGITVDNELLPYQNEIPGSYEGQVIAESTLETLAVPFSFIKSARLEMVFDENPFIVRIHDGEQVQGSYYYPGLSLSTLLPQGTYDVWTVYGPPDTWVIREGVVVTDVTHLTIDRSEAVHTVTLAPRDEEGQSISSDDSASLIQHFRHTPSGEWLGIFWRTGARTFHFSDLSADHVWSWRLDTGWKEGYYQFNHRVVGIDGDYTYQNAPQDLWSIRHQCHAGPMQSLVKMRFCVPYG